MGELPASFVGLVEVRGGKQGVLEYITHVCLPSLPPHKWQEIFDINPAYKFYDTMTIRLSQERKFNWKTYSETKKNKIKQTTT